MDALVRIVLSESNVFDLFRVDEDELLQTQSIWALGHFAADYKKFRDYILDCNIVPQLSFFIKSPNKTELIKKECIYLLAHLIGGEKKLPLLY